MLELRDVRRGSPVLAADGERVGRVLRSGDAYLVIERGYCFSEHYFVRFEEIAAVEPGQVRLRVRGDALVPDTVSERWDPPCDPLGTDEGIDIEPLRAGMAEVDERQHGVAPADPRQPLFRHAASRELPRARTRPPDASVAGGGTPSSEDAIEEEIADFERAGSCADPDEPPRGG